MRIGRDCELPAVDIPTTSFATECAVPGASPSRPPRSSALLLECLCTQGPYRDPVTPIPAKLATTRGNERSADVHSRLAGRRWASFATSRRSSVRVLNVDLVLYNLDPSKSVRSVWAVTRGGSRMKKGGSLSTESAAGRRARRAQSPGEGAEAKLMAYGMLQDCIGWNCASAGELKAAAAIRSPFAAAGVVVARRGSRGAREGCRRFLRL